MLAYLRTTALFSLLIASPLAAQDTAWKVGLAEANITPEMPVVMSGYGGRTKPFEKVAAELFVKVMVLEDASGQRGVIVTSDLLGFPAEVAEPICERIGKKTGLKREQILLNSSHTHAGPAISLRSVSKDLPGEAQRTIEYTRQLQEKVVETVVQATTRMKPATLSHGSGVIHFAMNRREFTTDRIILGVNPRGLADRSVPILRVAGADGSMIAVLFGAATHGTTLGADNYQICGDYAGFAQSYLREKSAKAQAMFMLGCAGDSNPYPRGTMDMAKTHGKTLGVEVERVLQTKLRRIAGPLKIAYSKTGLPLQTLPRETIERLAKDKRHPQNYAAGQMLAVLEKGSKLPTHYACPLTVWQFGKDLTLVGLSGEVVVDYVPFLEKALGSNHLWIAGYCNDVFGYLPSARVLSEGGYETRGLYSGGVGVFDPRAERVVIENVRDLAKRAERMLPD